MGLYDLTDAFVIQKSIGPERCRSRLDTPRLSEAGETTPARHLLASLTRDQRAERPHTQLKLNQARQGQYVLIQSLKQGHHKNGSEL